VTAKTGWLAAAIALVVALPVLIIVVIIGGSDESGCVDSGLGQGLPGPGGVSLAGYNDKQLSIAKMIVAVGEQRGEPPSVIQSALMAALTESGLRNYANDSKDWPTAQASLGFDHDAVGHDFDSVGPFQMRVSVWGKGVDMATLMSPIYQANWFYNQAAKVSGANSMDPAALAQAIEDSAPDAYATMRAPATALYSAFRGAGANTPNLAVAPAAPAGTVAAVDGACGNDGGHPSGSEFGKAVVAAAMQWIGTPYVWGGGGIHGPTDGGFDCSGLAQYSVYTASHGTITIARTTGGEVVDPQGHEVPFDQKQPGDLILIGTGVPHHVAIFWGWLNGVPQVVHAPDFGQTVKVEALTDFHEPMQVRRFGDQNTSHTND
jgi:cell wall-associated NlpC family hydrolase